MLSQEHPATHQDNEREPAAESRNVPTTGTFPPILPRFGAPSALLCLVIIAIRRIINTATTVLSMSDWVADLATLGILSKVVDWCPSSDDFRRIGRFAGMVVGEVVAGYEEARKQRRKKRRGTQNRNQTPRSPRQRSKGRGSRCLRKRGGIKCIAPANDYHPIAHSYTSQCQSQRYELAADDGCRDSSDLSRKSETYTGDAIWRIKRACETEGAAIRGRDEGAETLRREENIYAMYCLALDRNR
jgi:hypothetical protein